MPDISDWLDVSGLVALGFLVLIAVIFVLDVGKRTAANEKINREEEERRKKREEAQERVRAYEELYASVGKGLKKTLLEDLEAIAPGEKGRLSTSAMQAAEALCAREGNHPETVSAWAPVLEDLRKEITDAEQMHDRMNDLLYPDALEDAEALKKPADLGLQRVLKGEKAQEFPEGLRAAKALHKIKERDALKRREEYEAKLEEEHLEKQKDERFRSAMAEMTSSSLRNIVRLYGLPENVFDGVPLDKVVEQIRTIREMSPVDRQNYISELNARNTD